MTSLHKLCQVCTSMSIIFAYLIFGYVIQYLKISGLREVLSFAVSYMLLIINDIGGCDLNIKVHYETYQTKQR